MEFHWGASRSQGKLCIAQNSNGMESLGGALNGR
nr:MAG TPA: hypothetical protein [Caudoviricetes sp.]